MKTISVGKLRGLQQFTSARIDFLQTSTRERLIRLTELCNRSARPVQSFYTTEAFFDWYKK